MQHRRTADRDVLRERQHTPYINRKSCTTLKALLSLDREDKPVVAYLRFEFQFCCHQQCHGNGVHVHFQLKKKQLLGNKMADRQCPTHFI